jgi:lipoate-protein ligase A
MAVDAAILHGLDSGESPPTLRIYGWKPWCVSLGYFQKPERELNPQALSERGWDVVMRPTGGRAVLHADELTYSLLARRDETAWTGTLADSYDAIGKAWAFALDNFGLNMVRGASPSLNQGEERSLASGPLPDAPAPPCFASSARAELAFDAPSGKRKVVGSAQRRTREAFVQHGSIPVTPDHERLVEVLPLDAAGKAEYLKTLRAHAVSLGEIAVLPGAPDSPEWTAWERMLANRLLEALGVTGMPGTLTPTEEAFAVRREAEHRERQRVFLSERFTVNSGE